MDLFSFILNYHLWNHFSIESRPHWRVEDHAIIGSDWDANEAVSSANVAAVISVKVDKSAL